MKHKHSDKVRNIPRIMIIGMIVAVLVTALGSVIAAAMILNGSIRENGIVTYGHAVQFLASLLCVLVSVRKGDAKRWLVTLGIAGIYLFILTAVNIMIFTQGFKNMPVSVLTIAAGAATAMFFKKKGRVSGKRHLSYSR